MAATTNSHGQSCIQDRSGKPLSCSANDIRIRMADNVRDPFGVPLTECTAGTSVSLVADLYVQTTAHARYDVGLSFAIDGDPNRDGAKSGVCSNKMIQDPHLDPAYPNVVKLGTAAAVNLDGDDCRDINAVSGWRRMGGRPITLRIDNVLCDKNEDNKTLSLPYCLSWSNDQSATCTSSEHIQPNSSLTCNCDSNFKLPVIVKESVVKAPSDIQLSAPASHKVEQVVLTESPTPQINEP